MLILVMQPPILELVASLERSGREGEGEAKGSLVRGEGDRLLPSLSSSPKPNFVEEQSLSLVIKGS